MTENETAKQILDASFLVHTKLGQGLVESVYEVILAYELKKRGLTAEGQKAMPIMYDDIRFDRSFSIRHCREWKSYRGTQIRGSAASSSCEAGPYAIASQCAELGLLFNFGEAHLKNGIK
jgi:hypothetical protein